MINTEFPISFPDEQYIQIPSLKDNIKPYYIISNYGTVYNINTGKMIIPHENENGYLQVSLMTKTGRVFRKVHRLVMICFFYFDGCESYQVNHKNGNKKINAYWNLEWSTPKDNISHAINIGLRNPFIGELNPKASITDRDARMIGEMLMNHIPDKIIADSICNGNINIVREIAYRRSWTHLFTEYEHELISKTRRGNIISIDDRHSLCKYYECNKNKYSGYGKVTKLVKDALNNIGLDYNNNSIFRIAKRLYYRYESPEITTLYDY